jgi:hypothetical protein
MNLYVYSEPEIKLAFEGVVNSLKLDGINYQYDENYCEALDVSYTWRNLKQKECCLIYPSASLWHRKIHELLFQSIYPVISPHDADYFIVPMAILYGSPFCPKPTVLHFEESVISVFCRGLPYWQYHKNRHVFFVVGDSYDKVLCLHDSYVFRPSCHKNSEDYVLYYDVILENLPEKTTPILECENKCSFIGCLETHPIRRGLPLALDKVKGGKIFESTPNFFSNLSKDSRLKMEARWIDVLNSSQFILAPRGCGLNSIRFYEALSFGRIPVLIADDTKLPLDDIINYEDFVVFVPESKIENLHSYIDMFLMCHDLEKASFCARETWQKYFSGGKLRTLLELSLPSDNEKINSYKMLI